MDEPIRAFLHVCEDGQFEEDSWIIMEVELTPGSDLLSRHARRFRAKVLEREEKVPEVTLSPSPWLTTCQVEGSPKLEKNYPPSSSQAVESHTRNEICAFIILAAGV